MKLLNLKSEPYPPGNCIRLTWANPQPDAFSRVRVVRRMFTHPVVPVPAVESDGTVVYDHTEDTAVLVTLERVEAAFLDALTLRSEVLTAFMEQAHITLSDRAKIFTEQAGDRWRIEDRGAYYYIRKAADNLRVYGATVFDDTALNGEKVYYYTLFPFKAGTGYIFNRSNRTASLAVSSFDFEQFLFNLLPAIYHRFDVPERHSFNREELAPADRTKGPLRRFLAVPAALLDRIYGMNRHLPEACNTKEIHGSLLPLLAEWIGWNTDYSTECDRQRNEIAQAPALYRSTGLIPVIESTVKRIAGWNCRCKEFVHNVFLSNKPERLNLWWGVKNAGQWIFYDKPLSLDFAYEGRPSLVTDHENTVWLFFHTLRGKAWQIWCKQGMNLNSWDAGAAPETYWKPDTCVYTDHLNNRHPQACLLNNKPLLFWDTCHPENGKWSVCAAEWMGGAWEINTALFEEAAERRSPFPVAVTNESIWLFWSEKQNQTWKIKYNTYENILLHPSDLNGTTGEVQPGGNSLIFQGEDLFVYHDNLHGKILVVWAAKEILDAAGRSRYRIFYTQKENTDLATNNWSAVKKVTINTTAADFHMREPVLFPGDNNTISLLYAGNSEGSWAVREMTLTGNTDAKVTPSLFSERTPLPFTAGENLFLIYRSTRSPVYRGRIYEGLVTADARYAGNTTLDSRDRDRINIMSAWEDSLAYTYDRGKNGKPDENDWYTRNTLGIYITTPVTDAEEQRVKSEQLHKQFGDFMPVTDRAVLIFEKADSGGAIECEDEEVIPLPSDESDDTIL